jgi:hypothetical protein
MKVLVIGPTAAGTAMGYNKNVSLDYYSMKILNYKTGLAFLEEQELLFPAQSIASLLGIRTQSLASRKNVHVVQRFSRDTRRNQNFIYESIVRELIPDPLLWKLVATYKSTGELGCVESGFKLIINAGLLYRSVRCGREYKIAVPALYKGVLQYKDESQPFATELPKEATEAFIRDISDLYIKAPFICQGPDLKELRSKVEELYPPLYSISELHKYYGTGFPPKIIALLLVEWSQHTTWQEDLLKVVEPFKAIKYGEFSNQPSQWPTLSPAAPIESYDTCALLDAAPIAQYNNLPILAAIPELSEWWTDYDRKHSLVYTIDKTLALSPKIPSEDDGYRSHQSLYLDPVWANIFKKGILPAPL